MDLLASDLVSSDSDDADYVPPPQPNRSEPRIRKRVPGIPPPSDDDDDDDEHDQLSDDAFVADRHALAASSSAAAASSSAAAAGSSAAHAAAAAAAAGAGAASASAGSSAAHAAAAAAAAGSAPPTGLRPTDDQHLSMQSARTAGVVPQRASEPQPQPQPNSVPKKPVSDASSSDKQQLSQLSQPSQQTVVEKAAPVMAVVDKAAPVGENHAHATVSASKPASNGEQPPFKRARVSPEKKSIDDIWAEMNNTPAPNTQQKAEVHNQPPNSALEKPAEKPSKPFKVRMLHDLEKEQTELNKSQAPQQAEAATPATGLEAILGLVRGKKPVTVLDGTRKQWNQFKKDEEVNEELETYKKGKERYTDRMAFLARSDVREWEFEQRGKRRRK